MSRSEFQHKENANRLTAVFHYAGYRKSCLHTYLQILSLRMQNIHKQSLRLHFTKPNSPSHVSLARALVLIFVDNSILLCNNLIQDQMRKSNCLSLVNTDTTEKNNVISQLSNCRCWLLRGSIRSLQLYNTAAQLLSTRRMQRAASAHCHSNSIQAAFCHNFSQWHTFEFYNLKGQETTERHITIPTVHLTLSLDLCAILAAQPKAPHYSVVLPSVCMNFYCQFHYR